MDFLKNLYKNIRKTGNKNFRDSISSEKKQKYLFERESVIKKRGGAWFFKKNRSGIQYSGIYTNFFQKLYGNNTSSDPLLSKQILWAIGWLLILLSTYIIFFSPYLRVSPSHVLVETTTPWIDINIAYRTLEEIYGRNLIFLSEESVALSLKQALKNIGHLQIDKLYPNGIKIIMESTPIKYRTKISGISGKFWYMSENGVLTPSDIDINTGSLLEMEIASESLRSELFLEYKQAIEENKSYLIKNIISLFTKEWPDLIIAKIRYFQAEREVHLSLTKGTTIIMTLEDDGSDEKLRKADTMEYIKKQLIWLKNYLETNKNIVLDGSISYIDIRIKNKIFVCREKIQCKNNLISIYGSSYE